MPGGEAPGSGVTRATDDERTRSRWLWVWAAACAAAIVLAFVVGTQVRSPWESAITNSQTESLVTAKVEVRTLKAEALPVTGTVSLGTEQTVSTALITSAVVTASHRGPGDTLVPGQVLAEVSGRPIIALALPFPMYRDLAPGDDGPDILALQNALVELGLYHGGLDGRYGPVTARAVEGLYRQAGVTSPKVSQEAAAALRSAESALAEAQRAELPEPSVVAAAREDLASARDAALVPLPQAEVLAVTADGVIVVDVAPVGTVVGEADSGLVVATVRSGAPTVVARVPVDQVDSFAVGTQVTVVGIVGTVPPSSATVVTVGDFTSSSLDPDLLPGRDVTLSLASGASFGEQSEVLLTLGDQIPSVEGLTVPLVAVREDPEGTFVLRLPDGPQSESPAERVPVVITAAADGYALVEQGALQAGELVVVSHPS